MDTTQPPENTPSDPELDELATADPADAPEIAETLAASLSSALDEAGADR